MTVGRTSTISAALSRTIAAILLVDLLPGVKADCWIDWYGYEHCSLSVSARVGLAFAILILVTAMAWFARWRWRRAAPADPTYAQQNQPNGGSAFNGQPPYAPQYPPQALGGLNGVPQYAYNPNTGFAPPPGLPPQNYPLPPGALQVEHHKEPSHV
ncbi:hypothetical protein BJY52DRAFT_1272975 [Lactarius psammicola]|nr:hypothetical protein BJY52DRAFT_1272975 [Lactarius psammicola]